MVHLGEFAIGGALIGAIVGAAFSPRSGWGDLRNWATALICGASAGLVIGFLVGRVFG
jgi:hypothetical protein